MTTGTVTGVTGYPWYAGGQWRVMSQIVRRFQAPYRCAPGVGWTGSRSSDRFQCHRLDQRHGRRTAVPILSLGT
jgi:hypothetical protein